jgi:hypothetical protein
MKIKTRIMRSTAALLSFALIHGSFAPEAWAQVTPVAGVSAPLGGGSGAVGSSINSGLSQTAMPTATAMSLAAAPTFLTASAPSFAAAPSAAASLPVSAISPVAAVTPLHGQALTPAVMRAAPVTAAAPALSAAPAASIPAKGPSAAPVTAAPALSETAAASSQESGPKSQAAGSLVSRRIAELKSFFGGRKDAGSTGDAAAPAAMTGVEVNGSASPLHANSLAAAPKDGDKVAQSGGDNAPPAPPSTPSAPQGPNDGGKNNKASKGAWMGLGIAGFSIIGYMLTMQIGLEAQGVAMPQLTENAFKDFTLLPLVTVFASIGSMIGQPMAKYFTEHLGLAKTFYAAHALRAVSLGVMVVLFGTGMMSMPVMMGFYLLNGIVTGVASTSEGTLRKLILTEKGVSMQSFRTWWQFLAETLAVPAPIFFGALVHSLGAIGAPLVTAVYPITIMLGLLLAYVLRIYPMKDVKKASDTAAAQTAAAKSAETAAPAATEAPTQAPAPVKTGVWQGIKNAASKIFANMEAGKNYVMGIPYLKFSLAAAVAFDLFNIAIYRLIAPGYGKMTGGAAGLSAVQGNLVGMFSLGGLILSVVFLTLESRAKARAKAGPMTPEEAAAAERSSMLRWMLAGIPAIALLATMAFHLALPLAPLIFLGTNWMPGSMLAAALIPFGFFQVAASIKLNSYFQEKLPSDADKVQKALAFSGSVMTALSIITMLTMRPLFSAVDVFNPFPWVAMALVPIAAGLFMLYRKLAGATKPDAIKAADEAQAQREAGAAGSEYKPAGAYVGLILGIVAAAVVITALPMIPGVAGFMAALGVLPKFALNLALTLVIPAVSMLIGRAKGKKK